MTGWMTVVLLVLILGCLGGCLEKLDALIAKAGGDDAGE